MTLPEAQCRHCRHRRLNPAPCDHCRYRRQCDGVVRFCGLWLLCDRHWVAVLSVERPDFLADRGLRRIRRGLSDASGGKPRLWLYRRQARTKASANHFGHGYGRAHLFGRTIADIRAGGPDRAASAGPTPTGSRVIRRRRVHDLRRVPGRAAEPKHCVLAALHPLGLPLAYCWDRRSAPPLPCCSTAVP